MIKIEKKEDKKVTLDYIEKDSNDNPVVSFHAEIGTGVYDATCFYKTISNKVEYFSNLSKYDAIEKEFEDEYKAVSLNMLSIENTETQAENKGGAE